MWCLEMPHILGKYERGKYETGLTDIEKGLITKAARWNGRRTGPGFRKRLAGASHRGVSSAHLLICDSDLWGFPSLQNSADGKPRWSAPFQEGVPGHLPVGDGNSIPVNDDAGRPEVVVKENKHREVHSEVLAMLLKNFRLAVACSCNGLIHLSPDSVPNQVGLVGVFGI